MHFIAVATLVGSAIASNVYDYESSKAAPVPVYTTTSCTGKGTYTTAKPYYSSASAAPVKPVYYSSGAEVTYTSYAQATHGGKTYSSAVYSVSTCTQGGYYGHSTASAVPYYSSSSAEAVPVPYGSYSSSAPYYQPPSNTTSCSTDVYGQPTGYAQPSSYEAPIPTYTHTYYTTVCGNYGKCYGTTVTSTYCPSETPYAHPTAPAYSAPYSAPVPAMTTSCTTSAYVAPSAPAQAPCPTCPGGYSNGTTTYPAAPPSYTGAASSNVVSFSVAAVAGLMALFIAA